MTQGPGRHFRLGSAPGFSGVALRVAVIYLLLGLAWIFGSDSYLHHVSGPEAAAPVAQLVKGSAFVAVSSLVIFLLVRHLGLRAEAALRSSEARLSELTNQQEAILDSVFANIALIDGNGAVRFANRHWSKAATTAELPQLLADVGANYVSSCRKYRGTDEAAARRIATSLQEVLAGTSRRAEFEFPHLADGQPRWSRIAITPYSADGLDGAVVATLDVTDQRLAESRMRLVNAAFRSTDEAILICDERFLILEANDAYLRMTGLERVEALESKPAFLEIGDQARSVGRGLAGDGHWRGELVQQRVNGETFISSATVNAVKQPEGGAERVVITFTDISAQRYAEQRAQYLTVHDAVTNLPNRRALEQWFESNVKSGGSLNGAALIYLDLDRFKTVNESLGHDTGDELLKVIARRLQESISPQEALARLGGDEFLVVVDASGGEENVVRRARALLRTIADPWRSRSREVLVSASAGISVYPRDGLSLEELLREADAALHQVKAERRRGGVSVFRAEMKKLVDDQQRIERGLRFAVKRGELVLEYQPVVTLRDGIVCGAEALVRWDSPDLGWVGPDQFIPVAEETGLISDIGHWVLEQVCMAASRWRGLSTRLHHLAVNISAVQFQQAGLVEQVETLLRRFQVPGSLLRFEITESLMMLDPDWTLEVLDRLRSLGVEIAIDDFGTGYSSLSYLRELPAQCIKLDKDFIKRLPESEHDAHIMQATIELAHRLGLRVVAEGLETWEQLSLLSTWGCDEGQGFFIGRPMGTDVLESMLRKGELKLVGS